MSTDREAQRLMGRIACPEHGMSGIAFGCPHVRAAVLAKTPVPAHEPYSIHIDGDVVGGL